MIDLKQRIQASIDVKLALLQDAQMLQTIEQIATAMTQCLGERGQLLFCGNGGSAADAQHLAAEFSGRFYFDRAPLNAEALHVNTSYLTAVGNDYSYDEVYARLVRAKGKAGDVLVGISTSGNSANVVRALDAAKELGMITIGMTGASGGEMKNRCDYLLNVPSTDTPRIQECHILLGHLLCEWTEEALFAAGK